MLMTCVEDSKILREIFIVKTGAYIALTSVLG